MIKSSNVATLPGVKVDEILDAERSFHDKLYASVTPFGVGSLAFSGDDVRRWSGESYQSGSHVRGSRTRRLFELLQLEALVGKRVLDVACGNGQYAVFIAKHGAEVWGFDISEVGIMAARRIAAANGCSNRCHFDVGNASALAYPDDFFDVVLVNAALHHLFKYPNVKAEIFRVLVPGGRLIFADIIRDNLVYSSLKRVYRYFRPDSDYGDDVGMRDYHEFARGFEDVRYERFCLLEGVKACFSEKTRHTAPCRALLYMAVKVDALLLQLFPGLCRYCLEIIGTMTKASRMSS